MKKLLTYLTGTLFLFTVLLSGQTQAGNTDYVFDGNDPAAMWWISIVFFNGPDHNRIQYYGEITPVAIGIGPNAKAECRRRGDAVAELIIQAPEFMGMPWLVLCTPIDPEHPENIHLYNQSLRWLDDYPEDLRPRFENGAMPIGQSV